MLNFPNRKSSHLLHAGWWVFASRHPCNLLCCNSSAHLRHVILRNVNFSVQQLCSVHFHVKTCPAEALHARENTVWTHCQEANVCWWIVWSLNSTVLDNQWIVHLWINIFSHSSFSIVTICCFCFVSCDCKLTDLWVRDCESDQTSNLKDFFLNVFCHFVDQMVTWLIS